LFDAGNSAHALLVSTVGFALYFRDYLFVDNPQVDSLWALITVVILLVSAISSPLLTSWLYYRRLRWIGLIVTTGVSILATTLLGFDVVENPIALVALYAVSAIGYYIALPIYTSYLSETSGSLIGRASATGWAVGYIGGILAAAIALFIGSLTAPIATQPEKFREIFVLAGIFNLIFSLPMLLLAWKIRRSEISPGGKYSWRLGAALDVVRRSPNTLRLLIAYWMVGESATIALYFTAIFLSSFAGMPIAKIFALTLAIQFIAALSTWAIGRLAEKFGSKELFRITCLLWVLIPPLLWSIKIGISYWIPLIMMGLALGAHHTLVRAEVVRISLPMERRDKGSLFGFLEVSGRVSSIAGPLIVGFLALFVALPEALLVAAIFPLLSLAVIRKYKWLRTS